MEGWIYFIVVAQVVVIIALLCLLHKTYGLIVEKPASFIPLNPKRHKNLRRKPVVNDDRKMAMRERYTKDSG